MSIAAANVAPNFLLRRVLHAQDLRRLDEPVVIFEHHGFDDDGAQYFVYSIGGCLDGQWLQEGATVGGDVIVIHADNRDDADQMACLGLEDTINALDVEEGMIVEAQAALRRLSQVNALDRIDLATRTDRNEDFEKDSESVRLLRGDDIVLTSGH